MNDRPLLVTTPIYYVNDKPHIGHAYTSIAADALARYRRSLGQRVFFLTGTDEHGEKVEKAAAARGVPPKSHADELAPRFVELARRLGISYDAFVRTTDAPHLAYVQKALVELESKGQIRAGDFEGWYCVPCERYVTEKELDDGDCPLCGRPVERRKESGYFFRLSAFRERIREAIDSGRLAVAPEARRNELLAWLEKPLEDWCISRPVERLSWGVPFPHPPFRPGFVTHVWFDALLNYCSGPEYLVTDPAFADRRGSGGAGGANEPVAWTDDLEVIHLIGKDILVPSHGLYWPAMLMALGRRLPDRIVAHGWWKVGESKMSKSLGNVVDPHVLIEAYGGGDDGRGADVLRYFVLREVPFGQDGNFTLEALEARLNAELADDLGNLVGRVTSLVDRAGDRLPAASAEADAPLREAAEAARRGLDEAMARIDFSAALQAVWALVRATNEYVQARRPWEDAPTSAPALAASAEALRHLSAMLSPFLPHAAAKIAARLGLAEVPPLADLAWGNAPPERAVRRGEALFLKRKPAATEAGEAEPRTLVSIDDFARVDLRIGVVTKAEKVPKKDRLLKLEVDLGEGAPRTLIAGIAARYAPEKLAGKRIVVVANLKPARIAGILSQGMLLAADEGNGPVILSPEVEVAPGTKVR